MRPPLRCDLAELPEADRPRLCAYLHPTGSVWVAGGSGLGRYGGSRPRPPLSGTHALVAARLRPEDVEALDAHWQGSYGQGGEARICERLRLARDLGRRRAEQEAAGLRGLRRGQPPPGSLVLGWWENETPATLVRFPDGTGWSVCGMRPGRRTSGWAWDQSHVSLSLTEVAATGLHEEACARLAVCEDQKAALALLRQKGWNA